MDERTHLALAPDSVGDGPLPVSRVAGPLEGPATAAAHAPSTEDRIDDDGYQRRLGARLRAVRRAQGLRLQDVEERSEGRFKAVVVGSYERGDRAVATHKLAALASFYGVPVSELLPDDGWPDATPLGEAGVRLSVSALHAIVDDPEVASLQRLVQHVRVLRGDHHGQVLTLRGDDLRTVAITLGLDVGELAEWLEARGLLARR
ncbi:transcriptional regulator [Nitriliruptor alkaliphilus]|uniref:transcriptional regulator n=1 Tax=Nitriliruptor alkaliphilus TaxID=427918 RepID=UPI000A565CF5|nr:transcriptional regulator [Nitriliruptor alkaliphilus]